MLKYEVLIQALSAAAWQHTKSWQNHLNQFWFWQLGRVTSRCSFEVAYSIKTSPAESCCKDKA